MNRKMVTVDGNTACAHVVHATIEIITIYPITPSSPIAELCDAKSAANEVNIWGSVPMVSQMQSEVSSCVLPPQKTPREIGPAGRPSA
jgi:pyruvate-ferredoxin/flavodoxin oxidoreductase